MYQTLIDLCGNSAKTEVKPYFDSSPDESFTIVSDDSCQTEISEGIFVLKYRLKSTTTEKIHQIYFDSS